VNRPLPPLWTRDFVLTVAGTAAFFAGFYLLIPVLPPYASALGASKREIGLLYAVFPLAAAAARFVAGPRMDRSDRKPILLAGLAAFAVVVALHGAVQTLGGLFVLRALHGMSWGCLTTAVSAMVSDLAPPSRRGEAIGFWGLAPTVAMALAPVAAEVILLKAGSVAAFFVAAALSALALATFALVAEPARQAAPDLPPALPYSPATRLPSGADLPPALPYSPATRPPRPAGFPARLPRGAVLPAVVLFLSSLSYGALVAFLPVEMTPLPGRAGIFFSVYALAILVTRPLAGRLSDRLGRGAVIHPGLALGAAGALLLGFAPATWALPIAAGLYGAGIGGCAFPGLMTLTVDRCPPRARGSALAAYFTAYDFAIAGGSALLGLVYEARGFFALCLVCAAATVAGQVVLQLGGVKIRRGGESPALL